MVLFIGQNVAHSVSLRFVVFVTITVVKLLSTLEKFTKYIKYLIPFLRFYFGHLLDNLFLKSNKKCIFYHNKHHCSV